jgi:hypothetical protein
VTKKNLELGFFEVHSAVGFRLGKMEVQQYNEGPGDAMEGVQQTSVTSGLPPPQLQNIVATVNLDTALNLKDIAMRARNAEYNPKRFAAVIMRIRDPKTTALIFASGKMVVTGARSEDAARVAGRKYARIIQKLGFAPKYKVRLFVKCFSPVSIHAGTLHDLAISFRSLFSDFSVVQFFRRTQSQISTLLSHDVSFLSKPKILYLKPWRIFFSLF